MRITETTPTKQRTFRIEVTEAMLRDLRDACRACERVQAFADMADELNNALEKQQ